MTLEQATLCETIKRMGYTTNTQMMLYGRRFELVSDPVCIGNNLVFVRVQELGSVRVAWARLPLTIVRIAQDNRATPVGR